jgi:hypothetical protein
VKVLLPPKQKKKNFRVSVSLRVFHVLALLNIFINTVNAATVTSKKKKDSRESISIAGHNRSTRVRE